VGPAFATRTKDRLPAPLGPSGIAVVAAATSLPVIAIGGVRPVHVPDLLAAGAHGVAVVTAISEAADAASATLAFLRALPDAVDVIVRGIKAGLPLFESIKVVAADAPEPLKGEFLSIIETQAIGMPLGEACVRLYERMPLPEANFFGIVISIQQKSGGNLSEALGNLSKVLRDRKKMAEKIQAMSMEAKASAGIIGSLPPIVMLLVYLSTPDYISLLWTHPTGQLMLVGCVVWMTIGILVMKKMINFDF
jgi:tight adherence protein B